METECEIKAQEKLLKKTASECFVDSEAEAIEIAKKLCTVEYDEISVEYFGEGWTPKEYEVTFLKNGGSEYGEQSVWITENGIVEHITSVGYIFPLENLLSFLQEACSIPILGEGIANQCHISILQTVHILHFLIPPKAFQ